MQERSAITKTDLAHVLNLIRHNKVTELKSILSQSQLDPEQDYFIRSDINLTLRDAIRDGHEDVVRILLEAGWPPGSTVRMDGYGESFPLIYYAVKAHKLNMVKLLVEHGAEVYKSPCIFRSDQTNLALRTAVLEGQAEIVDFLLCCGGDANGDSGEKGRTLLGKAAENGNKAIVESLVKYGANVPETIMLAYNRHADEYQNYKHGTYREYGFINRASIVNKAFKTLTGNDYDSYSYEFSRLLKKIEEIKNDKSKQNELFHLAYKELSPKVQKNINFDFEIGKKVFDKLLNDLQKFDNEENKRKFHAKKLIQSYEKIVRTCLDYAMGFDLDDTRQRGRFGPLEFLSNLNISDMNFIGVSIGGQSISRMLLKKSTKTKAITTTRDLERLEGGRKKLLQNHLDTQRLKRAVIINKNGFVRIISLEQAVRTNHIKAVKKQIQTGFDLNQEEKSSMTLAAKLGRLDIVKLLDKAHAKLTQNQANRLVLEAKEFLTTQPVFSTISLIKGKLQNLPVTIASENCQAIILGPNKLTPVIHAINKFGRQSLKTAVEDHVAEHKYQNRNFITALGQNGMLGTIQFPINIDMNETQEEMINNMLRNVASSNCPVIFTNFNNFPIIQELINLQYEDFDKHSTNIIEAIEAARENNHKNIFDDLLTRYSIDLQDKEGNTLLHRAASRGDDRFVLELLSMGANVHVENNEGQTPLAIAAGSRYCIIDQVIKVLLSHGSDPNQYRYLSPMALAAHAGQAKVLAMLMPVTTKKPLENDIPWYADMMFDALNNRNGIEILQILKEHGADFNVKNENGDTLLGLFIQKIECLKHFAIEYDFSDTYFNDEIKMLDYLLANKADPNLADKNGQTPLMFLAKQGYYCEKRAEMAYAMMDRLLKHGAKINAVDKQLRTALTIATNDKHEYTIKYLRANGAKDKASNISAELIRQRSQWSNPGETKKLISSLQHSTKFRYR